MVVDADDLARLDLADVLGVDRVERARLAGDAPVPVARSCPSTSGRMPHGSRHGFDAVGEQEQQAERALQVPQHVRQRVVLVHVRGLGQQVDDDFGVGRALENVAVLFVLAGGAAGR